MEIGEKIKMRRMELGWSQRELARKMGYSDNSTLARIEQGKVDVYQNKIVQFSEVLGVSIAYLMDWEEEEQKKDDIVQDKEDSPDKLSLTEGEKMVLDLFRKIPEEKQPEALELLRVALKMQKKL